MSASKPRAIGLMVGTGNDGGRGTNPTSTLAVDAAPTVKPGPASTITKAVAEPPPAGAVTTAVMVQEAVVAPAAITIGDTQVVL